MIGRRYEIKRKLGAGALGEVFLAKDLREDKEICLKLLHFTASKHFDNLKNEFQILSELNHPYLIKVHDFGIDDKLGPFYTMEYAPGGDISALQPITPNSFSRVVQAVCAALEFIHSRDIIHSDIKPANILIDSEGNFRLSDFGLSFIIDNQEQRFVSGSALYIAPEALRHEPVTTQSDIYSLGLLFYELIAGKPLFDGDFGQILNAKLSGGRPIEFIKPEFGADKMAVILRKMTASFPKDRYSDIANLQYDIGNLELRGWKSAEASPLLGKAKFVGREKELGWLDTNLTAWRQGLNVALFIGGEAGVGKTWLLDEFRVRRQIEGIRIFRAYCRESDLRPLSPLLKILNQILIELDPGMERFAEFGPDLKRLYPDKYPEAVHRMQTEADIKSGRRRLFDNLLQYLGDITHGKGVVAIEDLQWADPDTIDFLKIAFSGGITGGNKALFLVCTGQTEDGSNVPDFTLRVQEKFLILKSESGQPWEDFLKGLLASKTVPGNFSETLFRETGGNFLFATEVVKELVEARVLTKHRGNWSLAPAWPGKINVPQGVKAVIGRRLSRLGPDSQTIMGIGAALGRSFLEEEIRDLAPAGIDVEGHLERLISAGILILEKFGQRERIDFSHGQLRRAVYDYLPPKILLEYHRKIAEYSVQKGATPEILGHHFLLADDRGKAFDYLAISARNAEQIYAFNKAADFYRLALSCVREQPESHSYRQKLFDIYLGLGKALDFLSPVEAVEPLSKAVAFAESSGGNAERLAEAAISCGNNFVHIGDNENALKFLDKGLGAAHLAENIKLSGEACTGLGFVYDKMGRLDDAEKYYLDALESFSDIDNPEGSCRVLNYMGIIRKRRGDFNGALDFYRRALDISLERQFLWSAMNLYGNLGNLYLTKNEFERGLEYYSQSLRISKEISDRRIESINLLNIGHTRNEIGDLEEAEKNFFEAIHKFQELGDKGSEAITLNNLGLLYYRKGEIYTSFEHYRKGLSLAVEIGLPRAELANRIGLAEDMLTIAAFSEARLEVERARELAISIDDTEQLAMALTISADLAYESGDMNTAKEKVGEYLLLSEQVGDQLARARILLIGNACGIAEADLSALEALTEKTPAIFPLKIRFAATAALATNGLANPEIWLARIEDAARKARAHFLPGEIWRLTALKIRLLESMGETFEAEREIGRLRDNIDKSLAGFGREAVDRLLWHLHITEGRNEANVIAMNMDNSREERLEVLFRVARTINTIRELDPLLNKIMDLALETLSGERGFILLYSDSKGIEEKVLEPRVARNLAQEDILSETTISYSSALDVARSGKPLLLGRADKDIDPRQSVIDFRISSVLCAPLAIKGEVLGIVYVDSRSGKTFAESDLEFLASFADLAAIAIENARLAERLSQKNIYLQKQVESIWGFGNIVGHSAAMQRVFRMSESVAKTDVTVVITGESGTGKELLARAIHFASPRKKNNFVPVDCGALAETLLESELFGYVKGAFTGASADREGLFEVAEGGTIFLDEISNTSKSFQAKLLRVLQEGEIRRVGDNKIRKIDVRVIAATNSDLEQETRAGNFREDLFYRLNVVNIVLPALKDKTEDIPILANYFLEKICAKMKLPLKRFSPQALDFLLLHSWPGNVRQLENLCERMVIFSQGIIIEPDDLPAEVRSLKPGSTRTKQPESIPLTKADLKAEKSRVERLFLTGLLEKTGGNVMAASRLSGMDRSQIHHLMSRFGLNSADYKKGD